MSKSCDRLISFSSDLRFSKGLMLFVGLIMFLGLVGCAEQEEATMAVVDDLNARVTAYVPTDISTDLSHLEPGERAALDELVAAGKVMHEIFLQQAWPDRDIHEEAMASVSGADKADVDIYVAINAGPWDRRFHHEPFVGDWVHPEGANYYPTDLTDAEKAEIEAAGDEYSGLFTMVRRDEHGALKAIPYSEYFAEPLGRARDHLLAAADLTSNESLATFLRSRAAAFFTDDYYQSDMDWMDLDSVVEITIGPYETYEDGLFGWKAAFEAFVTVTDPTASAQLGAFKSELPWLEAHLPIPDEHKNPNRGSDSPIRVVDEVFTAGDTRSGVQTIAFNLPNDERVREAKGSKKVLLRNIMDAKFDKILTPIAEVLVVPDQMDAIAANSFFMHTLWHEMSHGLGPGRITVDGQETEVRLELKDTYSTLEEAKADAMGPWCIFHMVDKGLFPETMRREQAVTYLAGLFRSVRFGIAEAHGQANAIQFNYLVEKGVITVEDGRFRINAGTFPEAIEEMVHDILMIQAVGDYEASLAMIDRYGGMPEMLSSALDKLSEVPVDILPQYALGQ